MTLEQLALDYLERGYSASADLSLVNPNGTWHRGLVRAGRETFLPEQVAQQIRALQEARSRRSDGKRNLVGMVLTTAPHRFQ